MKSAKYKMVEAWWNRWHSETMVTNAVEKGWITEDEAKQIMQDESL